MQQHSLITIEGAGHYPLQARLWTAQQSRALVVLVHGVVSHSLWLEPVTSRLAAQGIDCLAMDRRGAGLNRLARGDAPSATVLLADLDAVMAKARELAKHRPVHIAGACWGANYVVNFLDNTDAIPDSALLLAPSLFPAAWLAQRPYPMGDTGDATEEPIMPIEKFTDGPAFEAFIQPDPLRLQAVSPRLNTCMHEFSTSLWMKFLRLRLPTLLLTAEGDEVVDNAATLRVFNRLDISPKQHHRLPGRHGFQFDAPDLAADYMSQWILL